MTNFAGAWAQTTGTVAERLAVLRTRTVGRTVPTPAQPMGA